MSVADCPKPTRSAAVAVRYAIEDHIVVRECDRPDRRLDVWIPLIPDTPYQRVLGLAVEGTCVWSIAREVEFGNQMLYARAADSQACPVGIRVRYEVERLPVMHDLHPACAQPLTTPALYARHLAAEQFVDVTDQTRALAAKVIGSERNPLLQARRIYEHVTGRMTYDAARQSGTGSTAHALVCSVGNCNDIHALFISLARSAGIPARLVLGQALEAPPAGQEHCDVCGYHCWAECFVAGLGWIPVDASCACKYGTEGLFGDLEMNHVAWSVGRDLLLAPPQQGPRILFFAAPYAEVGSEPHRAIERRVTFAAA